MIPSESRLPSLVFLGISLPPLAPLSLQMSYHMCMPLRPRDSHCIHVDPKASARTKEAVAAVVRCYNEKYPQTTIFTAPDPVPVWWGHYSVLEVTQHLLNVK